MHHRYIPKIVYTALLSLGLVVGSLVICQPVEAYGSVGYDRHGLHFSLGHHNSYYGYRHHYRKYGNYRRGYRHRGYRNHYRPNRYRYRRYRH